MTTTTSLDRRRRSGRAAVHWERERIALDGFSPATAGWRVMPTRSIYGRLPLGASNTSCTCS